MKEHLCELLHIMSTFVSARDTTICLSQIVILYRFVRLYIKFHIAFLLLLHFLNFISIRSYTLLLEQLPGPMYIAHSQPCLEMTEKN